MGAADEPALRHRADGAVVAAAALAVGAPASGLYVLGIEPANCSVLGREHDIAEGRMPFLDPGEARSSWLTIAAQAL